MSDPRNDTRKTSIIDPDERRVNDAAVVDIDMTETQGAETALDDDVVDEEDRMRDSIAASDDASGAGNRASTDETMRETAPAGSLYEPMSGLSGAALSDDPDAIAQGGIRAAIGEDEPVNGEDLLADINVDEQNIDVEQQIVEIDAAMPVDVQMRRDEIDG